MDDQLRIKIMSDAYLEAIDFTEFHEDNEDYNPDTCMGFSEEVVLHAINTCERFLTAVGDKMKDEWLTRAGHDLWLTRNGHGVGFWAYPEVYGDELADYFTSLCGWGKDFPEVDAYIGDDNYIYFSGGE